MSDSRSAACDCPTCTEAAARPGMAQVTHVESAASTLRAERTRRFAAGSHEDARVAVDQLLDEVERLRMALETIKRTTKSGGAEAIARQALDG